MLKVKGIDIAISVAARNRLAKHPQIHCFFSYTMKPDASKLSSTIDYILTLPEPAFNCVDSLQIDSLMWKRYRLL